MNASTLNADSTLVELVAGVASEARDLVAAHAKQMRVEMAHEMARGRNAALILVAGSVLATLGFAFIVGAFIPLLMEQLQWPIWAVGLAEGGVVILMGAVLLAIGWRQWHNIEPVPKRTLESLHESLQCMTNN